MHLRTSLLLSLSALALSACTNPSHPSRKVPAKDPAYYFRHLDEAAAKKAQCLKERVYQKAGIDMENSTDRENLAAFPDDILTLNPDNTELPSCIAAWTAADSAEPLRWWKSKQAEKAASGQKSEALIAKFKAELEKKYADRDWKKFYPAVLYEESVSFLYTDAPPEEQAKREAVERIFTDKAKPFIAELETKNIETLTREMSQSCEMHDWNLIPSCKAYYHVLKEKFSKKTLSELADMEKRYNDGEHMPVPILSAAYGSAVEAALEKTNQALMSDYGKLDAGYRQCVKKIGDKIAASQIDSFEENAEPEFYFRLYPECAVVLETARRLELPVNLDHTVQRQIRQKQAKQRREESETEKTEQREERKGRTSAAEEIRRLKNSPEVAETQKVLAQKYAQIPWQDFEKVIEKDYPHIADKFSDNAEERRRQMIVSLALGRILAEKRQPAIDRLAKNSTDKLIREIPAQCRDGKTESAWMEKASCNVYFQAVLKKFQNLSYEELLSLKGKYEKEDFPLVNSALLTASHGKEQKWAEELVKNDARRETAYGQCLKNISKTIEKSDISEINDAESAIWREPGCGQVYFAMPDIDGEERFKYFVDTLIKKKLLQEPHNADAAGQD